MTDAERMNLLEQALRTQQAQIADLGVQLAALRAIVGRAGVIDKATEEEAEIVEIGPQRRRAAR